MSTGPKRSYETAIVDAEAFRALFDGHFEHWWIAGSVRRQRSEVGDVEHVVIGDGVLQRMNELVRCDDLFADPNAVLTKAVYPDGKHRWGERYRGVMFRGFRHEVFMATTQNAGAILAIRTGPADFSRHLVTCMANLGMHRMQGGRVIDVRDGHTVRCPLEEDFFALCREPWVEPSQRDARLQGRW